MQVTGSHRPGRKAAAQGDSADGAAQQTTEAENPRRNTATAFRIRKAKRRSRQNTGHGEGPQRKSVRSDLAPHGGAT